MAKKIRDGGEKATLSTALKAGDVVMVITGGNNKRGRVLKGQTGKILRFVPKKDRVVVEGLNIVKRHKKALQSNETAGIIQKEGSIHISNVMFYNQELKRPVRLKHKMLEDGRKVRGFVHPVSKKFETIDA